MDPVRPTIAPPPPYYANLPPTYERAIPMQRESYDTFDRPRRRASQQLRELTPAEQRCEEAAACCVVGTGMAITLAMWSGVAWVCAKLCL